MKTPCRYPGCAVILPKSGFCDKHQHAAPDPAREYDRRRHNDPDLAAAARFRNSPKWRRISRAFLSEHPMCADPFGTHARAGNTASAQDVHHITPIVAAPEMADQWENLMALCRRCHNRIERQTERKPKQ